MQSDQWGQQKRVVGLSKPGEGMERGFLEEAVNEMVRRAAAVGRGIRTSSGQEERSGHPSAPWDKELVLPSIQCVPVDGTTGGVGVWGEGFECPLAWPEGLGRIWMPDLQLWPLAPYFSRVSLLCFSRSGWRPAFCCSCCRWQQKPDKAHLFRAARGETM